MKHWPFSDISLLIPIISVVKLYRTFYFFNNVIFECLEISIEVIQGHRTLNFRIRP